MFMCLCAYVHVYVSGHAGACVCVYQETIQASKLWKYTYIIGCMLFLGTLIYPDLVFVFSCVTVFLYACVY